MDCNYKWISSTVAPPIRAGFRSLFWKPSFSKAVNGTYYVVEAVPDTSKRTTYIVSAYMTKNKPTGSSSANVQAPASTSETSTTIPVDNPTVPQAAANVNAEGVETRLSQTVETRLSQTVETVRDAAVTPDTVKQSINENIENGGYRYIPESNADAAASVRSAIAEKGYESVLRDWAADVRKITDAL